MIRNPDDVYDDEADGERVEPTGTPWTVVGLFIGLAIALALWCMGVV
jgi:hypothetical protein